MYLCVDGTEKSSCETQVFELDLLNSLLVGFWKFHSGFLPKNIPFTPLWNRFIVFFSPVSAAAAAASTQ